MIDQERQKSEKKHPDLHICLAGISYKCRAHCLFSGAAGCGKTIGSGLTGAVSSSNEKDFAVGKDLR